MTTSEKVAYLRGLSEGLGVDKDSKEGKILASIMDILGDLASDVEDLEANSWELGEAIDQVSDDLSDVEDMLFRDEDDWDDDFEDEDDWDDWDDEDEDEDEDGEPVFYDVTCPACENTITIDEDVLDLGAIDCPNCGERLEFDGIEEDFEDE